MKKIIIYTEGGFKLGLGNIYRTIELALSLKKKYPNFVITFVTSSENYVLDLIQNNGFGLKTTNQDALPSLISQQAFEILIIDKLEIEESFVQAIIDNKKEPFKTVIFGNLSPANKLADLVINAVIGTNFSNNNYTDEFKTKYLTGPKYLTLRNEFVYKTFNYRSSLNNILLLFGGSDQANFSCSVLRDLIQPADKYNITVVIGRGYEFITELKMLAYGKSNIKILKDITNVKDVMLENDFLITSPGTALFEGFYLGLPCLALYQNESQKNIFKDFFMTYSYNNIDDIKTVIHNIYNNFEEYECELKKMEIGQGKEDIINSIINLI